jgi:hypothetical protein
VAYLLRKVLRNAPQARSTLRQLAAARLHSFVVPVAEGSNPSAHPIQNKRVTIFDPKDMPTILPIICGH